MPITIKPALRKNPQDKAAAAKILCAGSARSGNETKTNR